jgi:hypothetical protein
LRIWEKPNPKPATGAIRTIPLGRATCRTLSNKINSIKRVSMRPLIALLATAALVAAPLAYTQQATPTPSPAATPAKKHRKKSAAETATTAASPAASPSPTAPAVPRSPAPKKTARAVPTPQATQAPGGGNGLVWVNQDTHVYHKEGSKWYGRTKHGKYESEQDAIKEGNHAAKNEKQ